MINSTRQTKTLLLELGCEELPAGSVAAIASAFATSTLDLLSSAQLLSDSPDYRIFYTPRRIAVQIADVCEQQNDQQITRRGPAISAAFDAAGRPTKAAEGFARSVGVSVDALERLETKQGAWLICQQLQSGASLSAILQHALAGIVKSLPMPKTMRWGNHELRFLRPLHWLLAMHGQQALPLTLAHLTSASVSFGHRVHAPDALPMASADDYETGLKSAYVWADPEQRKSAISDQIDAICSEHTLIARKNDDLAALDYEQLLDEVSNLVEWPQALACAFDQRFLQLPEEVLSLSMRSHQKFFPLYSAVDGKLSHHFIAVANLDSNAPQQVIAGYQRVIGPRLGDAEFFWNKDRQQPLEAYLPKLDNISFQQQLGSVADKAGRMRSLSGWLANQLGLEAGVCARAAELALCDLSTDMVGEFPELQGIMGRYYALASNEPPAVATAIEEHYQPRSAGDSIAASSTGQCLAIAEKCDRLLGIFAAGKKPDGNKDPYALRRAALGLVRTVLEAELHLDLDALLQFAADTLEQQATAQVEITAAVVADVKQFILDRLQAWLHEQQGISVLTFRAVAAISQHDLLDMQQRMQALEQFSKDHHEAAASLAAANKRVVNLLAKSIDQHGHAAEHVDLALLQQDEETALHAQCESVQSQVEQAVVSADYQQALALLAGLQQPVDAFFDQVMVMTDDAKIRDNRLALLHQLRALCNQFADIALLH